MALKFKRVVLSDGLPYTLGYFDDGGKKVLRSAMKMNLYQMNLKKWALRQEAISKL